MLKIGLTGNIGSGKSLVARIFSILDIPVYSADTESKKFLEESQVKGEIMEIFGPDVFTETGDIDKKALGELVFSDKELLNRLNSILHPRVIEDYIHWVTKNATAPYVILESAIIYESGINARFDRIIHVSCPADFAIERVVNRDHVDREKVVHRMKFQLDDKKKAALANYIIRNDGSELIIPRILSIHRELLEISA